MSSPPANLPADAPDPPPRQSVEVAIAIISDPASGKILICQRKADTVLGGYWEFPGGKCAADESPADCARRETAEETGLGIAVDRPLAIIEHEYPHARVRLHPFLCHRITGEAQPLQVTEARWIAPPELSAYRFPEANAPLIHFLLENPAARSRFE